MPPFELEQHETEDPNVLHVGVVGELDLTNARELEDRIDELSTRYPSGLVLDLNRVVFIDSAALHVLFRTARRHRIGIVLSPTSPIARTVEIVGLAEATALGDSLDAVVDALARR
jgi:anti-anti-sigma factor